MVTTVCSSSSREIENRIEADHPVVSACFALGSLVSLLRSQFYEPVCFLNPCHRELLTDGIGSISTYSHWSMSRVRSVSVRPQPAPASAGEESEEDQQFRTIFQEIAGDVSRRRRGERNQIQDLETLRRAGNGRALLLYEAASRLIASCLFLQDMEISANELKNVLNRVITKRESTPQTLHSFEGPSA